MTFQHLSFLAFCILLSCVPLPFPFIQRVSYSICSSLLSSTSSLQICLLNQILLFCFLTVNLSKESGYIKHRQKGRFESHKIFSLCKALKKMNKNKITRNVTKVNDILDCLMFYFSRVLAILFPQMKFFWKTTQLVFHF